MRKATSMVALAAVCAVSCTGDATPAGTDYLIPAGEPNVAEMLLLVGGNRLFVSKLGVVDGIVVLRPGTSEVHAEFYHADGLVDPVVTPDAFRVDITANNNDPGVVFVRSATDPFSGCFFSI